GNGRECIAPTFELGKFSSQNRRRLRGKSVRWKPAKMNSIKRSPACTILSMAERRRWLKRAEGSPTRPLASSLRAVQITAPVKDILLGGQKTTIRQNKPLRKNPPVGS